jgi:hypothetical protein
MEWSLALGSGVRFDRLVVDRNDGNRCGTSFYLLRTTCLLGSDPIGACLD